MPVWRTAGEFTLKLQVVLTLEERVLCHFPARTSIFGGCPLGQITSVLYIFPACLLAKHVV